MKISFVLGHELPFPPDKGGGVNSLLAGLCRALASSGHEVTAYSPSVPGWPDRETRDGVKHVRVEGASRRAANLANVAAGMPYAWRVFRAIEPCDILSGHLWHGFLFSRHPRARVVTHTIHRDPKKFLLLFSFLDRIYTGSDAVTADTKNVVPSLKAKLRTVYNAVEFENYPEPPPRDRDGQIRFIFVGRFSSDKGLETFIPAFCNAAKVNPNIRFRTVGPMTAQGGGDEALVAKMRRLVAADGLESNVEFIEPIYERSALDDVIRAADVVVLPSIGGETLNMSILECMRLGRALLISDLPANRPLTVNGETGFFAQAGNVEDWTKRILEMAQNVNRLDQFGAAAYRYGKDTFSTGRVVSAYVHDFDELLSAKVKDKTQ